MWPIVVAAIAGFFISSCSSSESSHESRTEPEPILDRDAVRELCDLPENEEIPAQETHLFQCAQDLRALESSGHSDYQRARSILHSLGVHSSDPAMRLSARQALQDSLGQDILDADRNVLTRGAASCWFFETCNDTDEGYYEEALIYDRGFNHLMPNMRDPE